MQSLKEGINALKNDLLSLIGRQATIRYECDDGVEALEATPGPESSNVKEVTELSDNRDTAFVEVLRTVSFHSFIEGQETPLIPRGTVTVRSNVTISDGDWHLIPGDVLKRYFFRVEGKITEQQKEEMMYYAPCSICKRTIFQINEEGCDNPICRKQGIPSKAEMLARKSNVD